MIRALLAKYKKQDNHITPIKDSFQRVAFDITSLQQHLHHIYNHTNNWHTFLHDKGSRIEQEIQDIRHRIKQHKPIESALESTQKQIHQLNQATDQQQKEFNLLHKELTQIKQHLHQLFSTYNQHIATLYGETKTLSKKHAETTKQIVQDELKQHIQQEVQHQLQQHLTQNRHVEKSEHHFPSSLVRPLRETAYQLSKSQKTILAIIASSDHPLTYKDIAATYGKSPSTVKTIVCSLKNTGIPLKEDSRDGIKRFELAAHYKQVLLSRKL